MHDLVYIWSLGFTPQDAVRAVTVALLLSLFMHRHAQAWRFAFYAFLINETLSYVFMAFSGHGPGTVFVSAVAGLVGLWNDLGMFAVRYAVIFAVVSLGFALRARLHDSGRVEG